MKDPLWELMTLLEEVSGVQLKKDKRDMVETRLARRVRSLNFSSVEEYVQYFYAHQAQELVHVISLITTHTTEFFREAEHFDYLFDHVFPRIFSSQRHVRIWSAAASTGQEIYSLAISLMEYMRTNSIAADKRPVIEILGTDIDPISLQVATDGIYPVDQVKHLRKELIQRYFDVGSGDLKGFVRVKDDIHKLCRFRPLNLISDEFDLPKMDVIFLRNAIIYFKAEDTERIISKIMNVLNGYLFLGHSESLTSAQPSLRKVGNSIYLHQTPSPTQDLIVIGASTGGVEALKVVLEQFPIGSPPILIVQHIPENFSKALANRLNDICQIQVSEARDKEILERSHAYIAPGGKQMKLIKASSGLMIEVNDDPPMGLHKPSVDYLFNSILPFVKERTISAALLTGMGSDGAKGLKKLRDVGVYTVAQNEETSVVFGMPGVAVELGGAVEVVPLKGIAGKLMQRHARGRKAA